MEDYTIEFNDGTILLNAKMKIITVLNYNVFENTYTVEILFSENGGFFNRSRFYDYINENLGGLNFPDVIAKVKASPMIGAAPIVLPDGSEV